MATWKLLIEIEMNANKDEGQLIACTLSEQELNYEFCNGWGCSNGKSFTAWTNDRVYFPVVYDGAEWVGSAPRNPCNEATDHHGGQ